MTMRGPHDGFGDQAWFDAWYDAFAPGASRFALPIAGQDFQADLYPGTARVLRRPWRFLRAPANAHTPQYGWKLSAIPTVADLGKALGEALKPSRCHGVELDLLHGEGATAEVLRQLPGVGWSVWSEERDRMTVIDVDDDWSAYWQGRSSNLRKSLGKQERQLARTGEVRFADSAQTGEWADILEEGLALEARGWKGEVGSAILNRPAEARFYRRAAEAAAVKRRLRLFSLHLSGRMIAFYLTMADAERLFWLKVAYDEQYAHYGPAMLLFRWGLAACFDDPSIQTVCISGTPEWTGRWVTRTEPLITVRAVPWRSAVGVAAGAEKMVRDVRARLSAPRRGA